MTEEQRDMLLLAAARHARNGTGRSIREQANMQQQEMARRVGISTSGLWRWENNTRRPRGDAAVRWAQQLANLELMIPQAKNVA